MQSRVWNTRVNSMVYVKHFFFKKKGGWNNRSLESKLEFWEYLHIWQGMKLCAFNYVPQSCTNTSILCLAQFGVLPEGKGATCHSGTHWVPPPRLQMYSNHFFIEFQATSDGAICMHFKLQRNRSKEVKRERQGEGGDTSVNCYAALC